MNQNRQLTPELQQFVDEYLEEANRRLEEAFHEEENLQRQWDDQE